MVVENEYTIQIRNVSQKNVKYNYPKFDNYRYELRLKETCGIESHRFKIDKEVKFS